jgi:hypothetical protein
MILVKILRRMQFRRVVNYTQAYAASFETTVFETYVEVKQSILCGRWFSGDRLDIIGPLIKKSLIITDFVEGTDPLLVMPKSASFAANYYDIEIY